MTPSPTPEPKPLFANCDEVRDAGKAPLNRDQPGYRLGLDADADGIACEVVEGATVITVPVPVPTSIDSGRA